MLSATLTYDPATHSVTLTATAPVAPPSGGLGVYRVRSFPYGKAPEVLADWTASPARTVALPSDGVYMLVLDFGDAGTAEEPISPPELLDQSTVATALIDYDLATLRAKLIDRHCRDAARNPAAEPVPLNGAVYALYARDYEAYALLSESALDAADRLLRYSLPTIR